jgi:hypothetical protein
MGMAMTFAVMVVVPGTAIGAGFRLELRTFLHYGGTQAFQHFL